MALAKVESVDGDYIDISLYNPLATSSHMRIRKFKERFNQYLKRGCFRWCHIKRFNPISKHTE